MIDADGRGGRVLDEAPNDAAVLAVAALTEGILDSQLAPQEIQR